MEKKKNGIKIAAVCTVAVLAVAIFAGAKVQKASVPVEEVKKDIVVKTEVPSVGDIILTGQYIGKVEPEQQITLLPKVQGEVLSANFQVGDTVKAGDVLCEIDSKSFVSAIAQTQAAVAAAKEKAQTSLAMAKNDLATMEFNAKHGFDNNLNGADTAVANAEAGLKSVQNRLYAAEANARTARRALHDYRDNNITPPQMMGMFDEQIEATLKDQVIQAELAVEAADLGVEQAKEGLETAKKNTKTVDILTEEQKISAQSRVKMAELSTNFADQQIAIDKMHEDLKNYTITSPIDGVIERRNIDPFDMASPQSPVYVISNKSNMVATFNVPASVASNLKEGDAVKVEIGSKEYQGSVTEIGIEVNQVGLFPIKVQISGQNANIMTGLTVTVTANTDKAKGVLTLPLKYVYFKENAAYVYALENGKAAVKPIEVGLMDDEVAEILSGIDTSTRVISTWSPDLKDGAPVVETLGE